MQAALGFEAIISVSTNAGATTFAAMPSPASRTAHAFASPSSPALDAA